MTRCGEKKTPGTWTTLTIASSNPPAGKDVEPENMVFIYFLLSADVTSFSHRGLVEALDFYWRHANNQRGYLRREIKWNWSQGLDFRQRDIAASASFLHVMFGNP